MSKLDVLLSKLDKVKRTGRDSYIACCPAHEDKNPSMTIRETEPDFILLHCFAECSVESILQAAGLDWAAVMPDKAHEPRAPTRRPFPAADVLEALDTESLIVHLTVRKIVLNEPLDEQDLARVHLAANRIHEARELINGGL